MSRLENKKQQAERRSIRVRSRTIGTTDRPRLSVHISNRHISAQIIDDQKSNTLVAATTVGKKTSLGNMTKQAEAIGKEIGQKAKKAKISKVVFDRGNKLYHGRIKALAEAARTEGLEF